MKAEPLAQLRLLEVQRLDARADQLRHQRNALPERADLAELETSRADVDGQRRDQQMVVDDLGTAQRKADVDVEQVKARRTRDRDRMDRGLITNAKDLARMIGELESLDRRISVLEDEELEVMERLEEAQTLLAGFTSGIEQIAQRMDELTTSLDEKTAVIDAELGTLVTDRMKAVDGLPADLVALYEKLRTSKGGVGAAELRARQCTGCSMSLDAMEVAEARTAPPDLVLRHEECQRILVRTPESGLTGTPAPAGP